MRLIDSEELEKALVGILPYKYVTERVVKAMPTIEAIPIEWLNKVIEHYRENGWHDDAEDLELLINDWREEQKNEAD